MAHTYLELADGQVIRTHSLSRFLDGTKLTKKDGEAKFRAQKAEKLRILFPVGSTVYTVLKSVSRSGMSRHIDVFAHTDDGPRNVSNTVSDLLGIRQAKDGSLVVGGCGMDMGFHVAYELSSVLYRDGFLCIGEHCHSNDHFNGDQDRTPHHHKSGGYALRHQWL